MSRTRQPNKGTDSTMSAAPHEPSQAMRWAALALLDAPATTEELTARFGDAGMTIDSSSVAKALAELAGQGLIRASGTLPTGQVVRTSLGDQLVSGSATGDELADRLADLERLRSDLLTTVAHELRTPLTSIRTAVGLLGDPNTVASADDRRRLLAAIERNAERLQRLADDVLDLARFRSGHVRLGTRRFDARTVASDVVATLQPALDARQQIVALDIPNSPVWVVADHRRMERALLNVLANAQKFSPDGARIDIAVGQAGREVWWTVTDRGPGIGPDQLPRLFERFFVGPGDQARSGSGLGLPITLAIVQAHGGRVEVDSELGRGSSFRLVVPAESTGDST